MFRVGKCLLMASDEDCGGQKGEPKTSAISPVCMGDRMRAVGL